MAFSRGPREVGRVSQDKTWGDALGQLGAARPGRLEWSVGKGPEETWSGGGKALGTALSELGPPDWVWGCTEDRL